MRSWMGWIRRWGAFQGTSRGRGCRKDERTCRRRRPRTRVARVERCEPRLAMAGVAMAGLVDENPEDDVMEYGAAVDGWHAERQPADVDADGSVAPRDALIVLNDLASHGIRPWDATGDATGHDTREEHFYLDVDGNGWMTPADVLAVIETLAARSGGVSTLEPRVSVGADELERGEGEEPGVTTANTANSGESRRCGTVPADAGPVRYYMDADGRTLTELPEWRLFDDLANEVVVIDDSTSPFAPPNGRNQMNDDTGLVFPIRYDVPLLDDSHLAWLEVVGVRRYYVLDRLDNWSNNSTERLTSSTDITYTTTYGASVGVGASREIGKEIGLQAEGVAAKVGNKTGLSFSASAKAEFTQSTSVENGITVSPCSAASLYRQQLVTDVIVDYVYMNDTIDGYWFGFTRSSGRTTIQLLDPTGTRFDVDGPHYADANRNEASSLFGELGAALAQGGASSTVALLVDAP